MIGGVGEYVQVSETKCLELWFCGELTLVFVVGLEDSVDPSIFVIF
jgi:hypothetical protein